MGEHAEHSEVAAGGLEAGRVVFVFKVRLLFVGDGRRLLKVDVGVAMREVMVGVVVVIVIVIVVVTVGSKLIAVVVPVIVLCQSCICIPVSHPDGQPD